MEFCWERLRIGKARTERIERGREKEEKDAVGGRMLNPYPARADSKRLAQWDRKRLHRARHELCALALGDCYTSVVPGSIACHEIVLHIFVPLFSFLPLEMRRSIARNV